MTQPTDIIICLGNGSSSVNDELRIMLRSLEKYVTDFGRILVATHYAPKWLDRSKVEIIDIDDTFLSNKDANLHYKTLETIRRCGVRKFCWLSDDVVFNSLTSLAEIPILFCDRPLSFYDGAGIWKSRMRNTLNFVRDKLGIDISHSYEVHAPQVFDGELLLEKMDGIEYAADEGLTIFTTWRAVCGEVGTECEQPLSVFKETFNDSPTARLAKFDRPFIGYNDAAFNTYAFRKALFAMFPDKSSFERYL